MATSNFESALGSLMKEQERSRLLKILAEVRKGVEGSHRKENIRKIYERGSLSQLIKLLQDKDPDVLKLCLSILGYCCMDRVCARESVQKYGILLHLSNLLKNYDEDSIQGRIFRIIGNTCQHWDRLANTVVDKETQLCIVAKIVDCVKSFALYEEDSSKPKNSEATIGMAVRALKELANAHTVIPLVKNSEVIKAVGVLLIKLSPRWQSSKLHQEVLQIVLKLLYKYSKRYPSFEVISQLQNTGAGNAMSHLGKLVLLMPSVVMQIMLTLLEVQFSSSDLPFTEIFQSLIGALKDLTNFHSGREDPMHREFLKCLCFLAQKPLVCSFKDETLNNNLTMVLLSVLKDIDALTEISLKNSILVISSLKSRCMYEDSRKQALLKHGIFEMISKILGLIVGCDGNMDLRHQYRSYRMSLKRAKYTPKSERVLCSPISESSSTSWTPKSLEYSTQFAYDFYTFSRCLSPTSDTSSLSPPGSPAMSLSDTEIHPEGDSDSDYSPICSEDEDNPVEYTDRLHSNEDELLQPIPEDPNVSLKKHLSHEIVELLRLFVIIHSPLPEWNASNLLTKLLKFLLPSNRLVCPPDTLNVILLIAQTPQYLLDILKTDFVFKVYKFFIIPHRLSCQICNKFLLRMRYILEALRLIVDGGCGKGDIAHQLYRASLSEKQKLVPSIPFVSCDKIVLNNLMITCRGLDILTELLVQNGSDMQRNCITGICMLALKIGVEYPIYNLKTMSNEYCDTVFDTQRYAVEKHCATIVRFKLDDGSCVEANREFLSQRSSYFDRLLCGEFKESWEEEVRLSNVPNKALKLLLMLLQKNVTSKILHKIHADLDILLDLIILTDRYLMEDLRRCVAMSVRHFKLHPTTIPTIYRWSLESQTDILRMDSVAYALVGVMDGADRQDMFQKLLQLGYNEYLVEDVQEILIKYLCVNEKN